jgi:transposase-like protein
MENKKSRRYPKEIRDKALRMVDDHQSEYPSRWACIQSIAEKLGMTPETLRRWARQAEDTGLPLKDGLTAAERMKALERENKELKRSNEILKSAAAFFGAELDRQHK